MLRQFWIAVAIFFVTHIGHAQAFEFPSKEGKLSLLAESGLIVKNKTTKLTVKSHDGTDLNDVTVFAINGSIAHSGSELHLNVENESFIYILALLTDQGGTTLKYHDFIGVPIAPATYPFISVYADDVPINPQRGVPGNTKKITMNLLHGELQGNCQNVFVSQVAVTFTDRKREVGSARKQGSEVQVASLLSRGASPHLQLTAKAESIGCSDQNGLLKTVNPKIGRTFTFIISSANLEKDLAQVISHMNAQNKAKASAANLNESEN